MSTNKKKRRQNRLEKLESRNLLSGVPPAPIDHARTVTEDSGQIRIGVITNDILNGDDPGEPLELVSITSLGPAAGTAVIDRGFVVLYTPAPNFSGTDTFTYTVTDSFVDPNIAGQSGTANIIITVTPTPDAPTAVNDVFNTNGGPFNGNVLTNDSDVDGEHVDYQYLAPFRTVQWLAEPERKRQLHLHTQRRIRWNRQLHIPGKRRNGPQRYRHRHA